jgi:putative RNase toxin 33 of polymorphic toxin system
VCHPPMADGGGGGAGEEEEEDAVAAATTATSESAEAAETVEAASGAQDRALSASEIKQLEASTGETVHQIKGDIVGKNVSKYDLYKNAAGDIVVKPKGSSGSGEPTGYTTANLGRPK